MKNEGLSSIYDYVDYKDYLKNRIVLLDNFGRGFKSKLARELNCQTAYVSQVFNGGAHFTPEQAMTVNEMLGHSEEECKIFVLRVQWSRAGTVTLKEFYRKQIDEIYQSRLLLRERFKTQTQLSSENQMLFYSEWYYTAIHILTSIPAFQSAQKISELLNLSLSQVMQALEFLVQIGLVTKEGPAFRIGKQRIHLGSDSPLISKHHINWRLQAMQSLSRRSDQNLHYSSVVSLSKQDAIKLREFFVVQLEQFNSTVAKSPEEECHCFNLDFFKIE